jgi:hypothetical protein
MHFFIPHEQGRKLNVKSEAPDLPYSLFRIPHSAFCICKVLPWENEPKKSPTLKVVEPLSSSVTGHENRKRQGAGNPEEMIENSPGSGRFRYLVSPLCSQLSTPQRSTSLKASATRGNNPKINYFFSGAALINRIAPCVPRR